MNRRRVLSAVGVTVLGGTVVGVAYLDDRGVIDIGDDAAVSETVDREPRSFEFDAATGDDIYVTVNVDEESDDTGSFSLRDPDGEELATRRLVGSTTSERHTAEQSGTYSLGVSPEGGRLRVSVKVVDPDE